MLVATMMSVGADREFSAIVFEVGAAAAAAAAAARSIEAVGIAADCQLQVAFVVGLGRGGLY